MVGSFRLRLSLTGFSRKEKPGSEMMICTSSQRALLPRLLIKKDERRQKDQVGMLGQGKGGAR